MRSLLSKASETVVVRLPEAVGKDPFGAIRVAYREVEASCVLVQPGESADMSEELRSRGFDFAYTLHFPRTWTEPLERAEVVVRGERCRVVGKPKRYAEEATPGLWNLTVTVGGSHG